ncbi:aconitase X [Ruegeria marina]|uniref:Phosphomevalonate dehydratase large subunit-like domain-containing protein n=1 Tax=Ruegeria marina TaxID=639004 RepID=A0A1G6LCW5_9RHOB|nr:aconitase X [Ruegeria marina]SDC40767.1 Protein of unknown function DUF126 [Ruegeria marina]
MAQCIVAAEVTGPVLDFHEGLSFRAGADPETGRVIDAHHPQHDTALVDGATDAGLGAEDFACAWVQFYPGPQKVELVAIGSPHALAAECRMLADLIDGRRIAEGTAAIVTFGRGVRDRLTGEGPLARLQASGGQVGANLCWCSLTEPVLPLATCTVMTNSGKHAH